MALSIRKFFQRKTDASAAAAPAVKRPAREKDAARLGKTVMPNSARVTTADDSSMTLADPGSRPDNGGKAPRLFSFGGPASPPRDLPPAVAVALEPRVERVIQMELSDVVSQMPEGFVRALSADEGQRVILLKAAELERGMATGKPSVSISTIYNQVNEIFVRPVPAGDESTVVLPFAKVLEQFSKVQLRGDQHREQIVPQVETPFLQATLEDDSKFGTSIGPLQMIEMPSVSLQPATAHSIAAAEPEACVQEKVMLPRPPSVPVVPLARTARTSGKSNGNGQAAPPPAPVAREKISPAAPTRIPFKPSPNGADASAVERVPASDGGASVPTSAEPTRIPFKLSDDKPAAKSEPWLTAENVNREDMPPMPVPVAPANETRIALPLKPILRSLPPFQLIGDAEAIPDEAKIELPFALVEPQLASGRVSIAANQFAAHLPEAFKGNFSAKEIDTPVSLPLQDVLKNLPGSSLRLRSDQEEQERGANFATPFSAKAEEDAKRFKVSAAPVARADEALTNAPAEAVPAPAPEPAPAKAKAAPKKRAAAAAAANPAAPGRTKLQEILQTDDTVDAKLVVAHVEKLPGVSSCAMMFADGLLLAGQMPERLEADALCAMAPSFYERVEQHLTESKLGALKAMTISCAEAQLSFFLRGNLCLAALHSEAALVPDVRTQLGQLVEELSHTYTHPV